MFNTNKFLFIILVFCSGFSVRAQNNKESKQLISSSGADTWVATDAIGRSISTGTQGGKIRKDKYVGIFYFIWQGAHGYDKHSSGAPGEGVMKKSASDTISPYDISQLLIANPKNPKYGPIHAFHHWGEPYFGYYLPDDEWIIRKHAQMLSDAGVDVLILDVTNAAIYLPQVTKIAQIYRAMRNEGLSTPSISFIVNSNPVKTVNRLYENIYSKNLFSDLWFYWKGKPLLLAPPEGQSEQVKDFFNIRQSWAWSKGQKWFGDGKDKWTWVDHTPQSYGWHESAEKAEQISVSVAEHPMSNIGRSFHDGKQPAQQRSGEGLYFAEQWKRALEVDPEFVFITGWNEWVAMRFDNGASKNFLGKPIEKGETYFVDLYNEEYSRDAEPAKSAIADNYYYQMINNIRKFKGSRPATVFSEMNNIEIDGNFQDWQKVKSVFIDDKGDTFHRKHPGWGRIKEYVNNTGRNDIIETRITNNEKYVSFYVKTHQAITPWNSPDWMSLFIRIKDSTQPSWEGYQFLVNQHPKSNGITSLECSKGGWAWKKVADLRFAFHANEMEIRIPRKALGITADTFTLDFKWSDNSHLEGNAMNWLDKGDAAPNARFAYRYTFSNN
ncbi:MAG: glycoside hydrolase family 71/99 protein [Daejeonella sp.]